MRLKSEKQLELDVDAKTVWKLMTDRSEKTFSAVLPKGELTPGLSWELRRNERVHCSLEEIQAGQSFSVSFESGKFLGVWETVLVPTEGGGTRVCLRAGFLVKQVEPLAVAGAFLKLQQFQECYLEQLRAACGG